MFFLTCFILLAPCSLALVLYSQRLVHLFQSEGYKTRQFLLRRRESPFVARNIHLLFWAGGTVASQLLTRIVPGVHWQYYSMGVFVLVFVAAFFIMRRKKQKKPLVYTARVVRLLVVFTLLMLALAALLAGLVTALSAWKMGLSILYLLAAQLALVAFLPYWLLLANFLARPIEKAIANSYIADAKAKLQKMTDIITIGVTGSYGKTSVKVILATILQEKFSVCATPHSYNTTLGVTRAIREELNADHQVFIAEMGARQRGDVAEICRLVNPMYGIITSVGPQHLETFASVENVARGKYELVEHLQRGGCAFFPADGGICEELYAKTDMEKMLYGVGDGENRAIWAQDITCGPEGSSFLLATADGAQARCTTRLLGEHNVMNIAGCAAIAYKLGMTVEEIAAGIAKAQPVEHRMQLIPTQNGITVIDDAFNSNPAGTRAALATLALFPGRKIVITPGLVELGDAQAKENRAFGRAMADVVDVAILVSRNSQDIFKGLSEGGFPEKNVIVTGTLRQASEEFAAISQPGDVVLFENDLPDHYER